ncbi:NAD-binding protein [Fodinisporobacter ferrooxydans]|uniref:NAD-binding protein n=1 Tax=Fodinisporobacter ferrooxydans TaxID=2901836 RepID=A0ABY4CKW9_9BACL|nr:NAD-binding protein [Alicyclobacillaceae bacterium MYW30-H2]
MPNVLVSTIRTVGIVYAQSLVQSENRVSILDCRSEHSKWVQKHSEGLHVLQVESKRSAFHEHSSLRQFDVAIVFEDDIVETALIVQSLKEAKIPYVIVVAEKRPNAAAYRSVGADRVISPDMILNEPMEICQPSLHVHNQHQYGSDHLYLEEAAK